jgi:hypothetical protein
MAVTFAKATGMMKPDRVESAAVMAVILCSISTPSESDPEHNDKTQNLLSVSRVEVQQQENGANAESEPEELWH